MALLANIHKDPKKSKTYSEEDFIPISEEERQQQMAEKLKKFIAAAPNIFTKVEK